MNDSHDIDMPYHPGCKHRYMEHLDHSALLKRLNEIADEIYRLTQLCSDMETRLSDHDSSTDAHRYLRDLVNSATSRISVIKESIDAEIAALGNRVNAADSTLAAADAQLGNRIDNLAAEVDELRGIVDSTGVAFETSINSDVSGDTPIIQSTADTNSVTLSELPSEHGNFKFSTEVTKNIITYTNDNNTSGTPNHTVILLDESGNSSFPGTVTADTFDGKATEAVVSDTAKKLETTINITVKDASGENSGVTATTDMSGDVTLKLPSTLKDTNITGTANKAISDGAGATITDTYMHKTNVNEEINGNKTFNGVIKGSHIEPTVHTGSVLGTSTNPYEYVYSTNITGVTANIPNVTGNLTGNADTATKLATARKINGTDFDGTAAITTAKWGTARNINVSDASGENVSASVSVDGSGNITLKLPATIKGSFIGNASTATQIIANKKINGTVFNGTSDVTTDKWGATRNLVITDSTGAHIGTPISIDGSSDITVKLPNIINGTVVGNADTATEFSSPTTVTLTGDATGTSAGSKRGWSVPVTLANSGVTAGKYGPSANVTGNDGVTIKVPEITVDAKGRVTAITDRVYTSVNDTNNIDLSLYPYKLSSILSTGNGKWEYINLENTDNNDFNSLVAPGKFQVRYNSNTLNAPVSDGSSHDGILDVEGTSSAAGVASYQRCYQTYILYGSKPRQFIRKGRYLNSAWEWDSEWVEFAKTSDIPTKTSDLTNDSGFLTSHQSLSNYVTLNGAQTITGSKDFSSNSYVTVRGYRFRIKNDTMALGTTPSSNQWTGLSFTGKDDTLISEIIQSFQANGNSLYQINVFPNEANSEKRSVIAWTYNSATGSNFISFTSDLVPQSTNTYNLGSASRQWKSVYANAYYLGTTAFGDIVTHNASEFLTSHQSLSNYVTLNSEQTISAAKTFTTGIKFRTDKTKGTAPAFTYEKHLISYVDSSYGTMSRISTTYKTDKSSLTEIIAYNTTVSGGSSIGSIGIGCDANGNVYTKAPTPDNDDYSTKIATTKWVKDQSYITADQATKVKQNKLSDDDNGNNYVYRILATEYDNTVTSDVCFHEGFEIWPSRSTLRIINRANSADLKGVAATNTGKTSEIIFNTYDKGYAGAVQTGTSANSRYIWLYASNYFNSAGNQLDPSGTLRYAALRLTMYDNGTRGIYSPCAWECGLYPKTTDYYDLGSLDYKWRSLYVNHLEADDISLDGLPDNFTVNFSTTITPSYNASTKKLTLTYTSVEFDKHGMAIKRTTKTSSTSIEITTAAPTIATPTETTKTLYYKVRVSSGSSMKTYKNGEYGIKGSNLYDTWYSDDNTLAGQQSGSWSATSNPNTVATVSVSDGGNYGGRVTDFIIRQTFKTVVY